MKSIAASIIIAMAVLFGHAQETKRKRSIIVTVNNIANNNGHVLLSLNTEATFMKSEGIQTIKSEIKNGTVVATFKNVAPGTYAIIALHDENGNNAMDFDSDGMPKEFYGTSNNPLQFAPPQFETAKFNVKNEDVKMTITF